MFSLYDEDDDADLVQYLPIPQVTTTINKSAIISHTNTRSTAIALPSATPPSLSLSDSTSSRHSKSYRYCIKYSINL